LNEQPQTGTRIAGRMLVVQFARADGIRDILDVESA